ncbi:hypothetical protein WE348_21680 (plasmid) [Alteromonas macleodii]|jgi:rubrerythrin|uniref:hypothetical protein n=1 Tax=Alteromonas macleodii TaxID=28108 RepID=UPI000EDB6793|nr:hypothetical protein [Pseudoalteromonas sp.]|tara:strand:+ start:3087 stop:3452 length:366 start_codon:yes stop_codon:yes gene_type:complete
MHATKTNELEMLLRQLLGIKTRYFFTWTGDQKTYRLLFSNGEVHKDVTQDMLLDAAKALGAPKEALTSGIKRFHFPLYELYHRKALQNVKEESDCFRCSDCGYEWSMAAGDNEVPVRCTHD